MSIVDPSSSRHVLDTLYPAGAPSLENALTETVSLSACAGRGRPMHPAQNARHAEIGWVCMACHEAGYEQSIAVVRPLPRLSWWRRAWAWFAAPVIPEARARKS